MNLCTRWVFWSSRSTGVRIWVAVIHYRYSCLPIAFISYCLKCSPWRETYEKRNMISLSIHLDIIRFVIWGSKNFGQRNDKILFICTGRTLATWNALCTSSSRSPCRPCSYLRRTRWNRFPDTLKHWLFVFPRDPIETASREYLLGGWFYFTSPRTAICFNIWFLKTITKPHYIPIWPMHEKNSFSNLIYIIRGIKCLKVGDSKKKTK